MRIHPLRRLWSVVDRMSPLQRDVTAALMTGDDDWQDEVLAERHGTTPGAVRIERGLARRQLKDALVRDAKHLR
jgi:hypothetical protein